MNSCSNCKIYLPFKKGIPKCLENQLCEKCLTKHREAEQTWIFSNINKSNAICSRCLQKSPDYFQIIHNKGLFLKVCSDCREIRNSTEYVSIEWEEVLNSPMGIKLFYSRIKIINSFEDFISRFNAQFTYISMTLYKWIDELIRIVKFYFEQKRCEIEYIKKNANSIFTEFLGKLYTEFCREKPDLSSPGGRLALALYTDPTIFSESLVNLSESSITEFSEHLKSNFLLELPSIDTIFEEPMLYILRKDLSLIHPVYVNIHRASGMHIDTESTWNESCSWCEISQSELFVCDGAEKNSRSECYVINIPEKKLTVMPSCLPCRNHALLQIAQQVYVLAGGSKNFQAYDTENNYWKSLNDLPTCMEPVTAISFRSTIYFTGARNEIYLYSTSMGQFLEAKLKVDSKSMILLKDNEHWYCICNTSIYQANFIKNELKKVKAYTSTIMLWSNCPSVLHRNFIYFYNSPDSKVWRFNKESYSLEDVNIIHAAR